jgi:N-acetylglucosaminyl-diphospho-decaprenol L-rhamnosyltransferase
MLREGMMDTIDVSVVIVNCNTRELLYECLSSLELEGPSISLEIILIDNGSTDGSVELVKERFPDTILQLNRENEGFARPNNDGMRLARGRFFFLLNSDARITPGSISTLVSFLDARPGVGACGPMLLYPDGRLQRSLCDFHTLWTHVSDMLFLDRLFRGNRFFAGGEMTTYRYDESRAQKANSIMGAAVLVRRETVAACGAFDEKLSIYYNEMDWFKRMRDGGWEVWYVPESRVFHHRGSTAAKVNWNLELHREMYRNVFHYFRKHYGPPAVTVYRVLLAAGFLPRALVWSLIALVRPSPFRRHMVRYCWRTFLLGALFWRNI